MTILFVGNEVEAFESIGTPASSTNTAFFDSTYVRSAFQWSTNHPAVSPLWPAAATETWLHFEQVHAYTGGSIYDRYVQLLDAADNVLFRARDNGGSTAVEFWNGSAFVTIASFPHVNRRDALDVQYRNTVDGRMAFYMNNYLLGEVLGDFSALADPVRFRTLAAVSARYWLSQVIVADEPTLGFHASYRQPTGAGAYTAWAGTWAEVDDILPNPSSFIASDTADQRENFLKSLFTVPNGFRVKAVAVSALARRGASGPQNIALSIRFGSTDYDSSTKSLTLGLTPVQAFWHTNPATSLPWVNSDAGSATLEFGVKAVA